MPADAANRKKRPAVDSTPAPDGDHRKRRRNRTTQSCLNCHASKRMCDRKRPACQRCTTLGLTGLCVYEVDDPSQRDTQTDEKGLLRSRVAELEGVIREMKNKPHPRWSQQKTLTAEDGINKWHSRARGQSFSSQTSDMPSCSSSSSRNDSNPDSSPVQTPASERVDPLAGISCSPLQSPPSIRLSIVSPTPVATPAPEESSRLLRPPHHTLRHLIIPSPASTPSPNSRSPVSDVSPQISIPGTPSGEHSSFDVATLFGSATLEPSGFEDGLYGHFLDQIMRADEMKTSASYGREYEAHQACDAGRPCECLDNNVAYNTVLELSVRLRKAAETLGRLVEHGPGADCPLYSKIAELDSLTSSTIGNAMSPAERPQQQPMMAFDNFSLSANSVYGGGLSPSHASLMPPTVAPQSLHPMRPWAHVSPHAQHGPLEEDPLMSWDLSRRPEWPHASL